MEDLVNFVYSGKVQITMANVQPLLVGASYLNLKVSSIMVYSSTAIMLSGHLVVSQRKYAPKSYLNGVIAPALP